MGSPEQVADVVVRVLTTRLPRDRYLVGVDARALSIVKHTVPTVVRDVVTRLGFGL